MRRTRFVAVNLTVPARSALQQTTLRTSADIGRRLSLSAVLLAALTLAERHPDELLSILTEGGAK